MGIRAPGVLQEGKGHFRTLPPLSACRHWTAASARPRCDPTTHLLSLTSVTPERTAAPRLLFLLLVATAFAVVPLAFLTAFTFCLGFPIALVCFAFPAMGCGGEGERGHRDQGY